MPSSIQRMPRATRRRLTRTVQRTRDRHPVRRALAWLPLHAGHSVSETARRVRAARSTVHSGRELYLAFGENGTALPASCGHGCWTVTEEGVGNINAWLSASPSDFRYRRTDWTCERLALALARPLDGTIHVSTVRPVLPRLGFVSRRARPVRVRRDPSKNRKRRAIRRALRRRERHERFSLDEADSDFRAPAKNALFPRLQRQRRARILRYDLYTAVVRAVLPCTHEKIIIFSRCPSIHASVRVGPRAASGSVGRGRARTRSTTLAVRYPRKRLAWSLSPHKTSALTCHALGKAHSARRPVHASRPVEPSFTVTVQWH